MTKAASRLRLAPLLLGGVRSDHGGLAATAAIAQTPAARRAAGARHHRLRRHRRRSSPRADPRLRAADPQDARSPVRRRAGRHRGGARRISRVLNTEFALERITVKSAEALAPAVLQALREPRDPILSSSMRRPRPSSRSPPRFAAATCCCSTSRRRRIRCAARSARARSCTRFPSLAMSMDALVQYLVSRKWRDVFVLQGPLPGDALMTKAFEASAKKFGAAHRGDASRSRPAPIRASASRTIRRC